MCTVSLLVPREASSQPGGLRGVSGFGRPHIVARSSLALPRLTLIPWTLLCVKRGWQLPPPRPKELPRTLSRSGCPLPARAARSPPRACHPSFTCRLLSAGGSPKNSHSIGIQRMPPPPVPGQWHLARTQRRCLGEGGIISCQGRSQGEEAAGALGAHARAWLAPRVGGSFREQESGRVKTS